METNSDKTSLDLSNTNEDLVRFEAHPIINQALSEGVDLRDYSKDIDRTLSSHQSASVKEYSDTVPRVVALARQIDKCDEVLQGMEEVLNAFRDRLETTTNQIKHLHTQSGTLRVKLQNRQNVETQLRKYLNKVTLSPRLIRVICEGEIDLEFSKCLAQLEGLASRVRLTYDKRSETAPVSIREVFPEVQRLTRKAVSRVRVFLLNQIRSLRKPNTNVQMVQQNKLRVFGVQFVRFVREESPAVYAEIERVYVATMATVFLMLFRSYHTGLLRMRVRVAGEEDVLARSVSSSGSQITASGVITSLFSNNESSAHTPSVAKSISIETRLRILQNVRCLFSVSLSLSLSLFLSLFVCVFVCICFTSTAHNNNNNNTQQCRYTILLLLYMLQTDRTKDFLTNLYFVLYKDI